MDRALTLGSCTSPGITLILRWVGQGPRWPQLPQSARPALDLAKRDQNAETVSLRRRMLQEFEVWLLAKHSISLQSLTNLAGKVVSKHLQAYGQVLYDHERLHGDYVNLILAVVDLERSLRRSLQGAWDVALAWHFVLPSVNDLPSPPIVAAAMVALALVWGWRSMAAYVMISFAGMMRPREVHRLRRRDLLFPRDLMSTRRAFLFGLQIRK